MSQAIASALHQGVTVRDLATRLGSVRDAGRALTFTVEARCVPYLADTVTAWVDGPPSSTVCFVLSGADPAGHRWRRWTISKVGVGKYEIGCFPTPFHNPRDPLSPGVPPSSSRPA